MTRALAIVAMLMGQLAIACAPGTLNICTHADGRSHVEFCHSKCRHGQPAGSSHTHEDGVGPGLISAGPTCALLNAADQHQAVGGSAAAGDHDCGNCTDRPLVFEQASQRQASAKLAVHLVCDYPMAGSVASLVNLLAVSAEFRQSSLSASATLSDLATVVLRC